MPGSLIATIAVVALVGLWHYRRRYSLTDATDRERALALKVAERTGSSRADALQAVRREMRLSPKAADVTLVNRAAYHLQRERPGRFDDCNVYWDRAAG